MTAEPDEQDVRGPEPIRVDLSGVDPCVEGAHLTPAALRLAVEVAAVARGHGELPHGRLDEDDTAALEAELLVGVPPRMV